jgi:hypothetical protein
MDSVLVSGAVHRGYEPRSSQIKDYEIGFLLSIHHLRETAKTGWL